MNYKERCRQRIQSRRGYTTSNNEQSQLIKSFYSLIMMILIVTSLVLGNLIHEKNGFDILVNNIKKIAEPLETYKIGSFIPFENWFSFGDDTVVTSITSQYEELENQYFKAQNNQVLSIDDGIVLYIATQATGDLILVKQDNGVLVTYGAMREVHVDENDRILKGDILGLVNDVVYMDFNLKGNPMSYLDVLNQ